MLKINYTNKMQYKFANRRQNFVPQKVHTQCCSKPSFKGPQSRLARQVKQKLKYSQTTVKGLQQITPEFQKLYDFEDENFIKSAIYHKIELQELSRNILNCIGTLVVLKSSSHDLSEDIASSIQSHFSNAQIPIDLNLLLQRINQGTQDQIEDVQTLQNLVIGWVYLESQGDLNAVYNCLWNRTLDLPEFCELESRKVWTPNRYPFLKVYGTSFHNSGTRLGEGTVLSVLKEICQSQFSQQNKRLKIIGDCLIKLYAYQFLMLNDFTTRYGSKIQDSALNNLAEDLKLTELIDNFSKQIKYCDVIRCLVGAMFVACGNLDTSCAWMQATGSWLNNEKNTYSNKKDNKGEFVPAKDKIQIDELIQTIIQNSPDKNIKSYIKALKTMKAFKNLINDEIINESFAKKRKKLYQLNQNLSFKQKMQLLEKFANWSDSETMIELNQKCGIQITEKKSDNFNYFKQYLSSPTCPISATPSVKNSFQLDIIPQVLQVLFEISSDKSIENYCNIYGQCQSSNPGSQRRQCVQNLVQNMTEEDQKQFIIGFVSHADSQTYLTFQQNFQAAENIDRGKFVKLFRGKLNKK